MSIKSDKWIKQQVFNTNMIYPFVDELKTKGLISYGISSYGYDIRIANEFKVFPDETSEKFIDPKKFNIKTYNVESNICYIPSNGFVLARSYEYIKVPEDCIVYVVGKSTYARCGLHLNFTVLEPGWEGHITLELTNCTALPLKIYAMEGIAQLQFFQSNEPCETSYSKRNGKYMHQKGITLPIVK